MDAVKFIKEKNRMCNSYKKCSECPIRSLRNTTCDEYLKTNTENYVKTVEKWSDEHPVKTRQSEFLKIFPNAELDDDHIDICPKAIDTKIIIDCRRMCRDCEREYWLAEVE